MKKIPPRRSVITKARFNALPLALGLIGLVLGTLLIGWFGFAKVSHAVLSAGLSGFALTCAWQMALFAMLGLCWFVVIPAGGNWTLPVLIWGRMVRDAAGGCLPFSLVGGFVFGARAINFFGVGWAQAAASTVVDLSAEFFAQIVLVLIGVVILGLRTPGSPVLLPLMLGLAASVALGGAFMWLQRAGASPLLRLSRRLLGDWGDATGRLATTQAALSAIYARPWRVTLSACLHLAAWFGTAIASLIAFNLLGAHLTFWDALGIEALLHAMLATAILVPGYAGVQEAAYAGVGALFGQPPEIALGVSLLRRARDIALGVPILLIWQALEASRRTHTS